MPSITDAATAAAAVRTATIPPGGMPSSSRQAERHAREFERLAAAARDAAEAYRTAGADIRRLFAPTADVGGSNVHAYACDAAARAFRALAAIADDGKARAGNGDADQDFIVGVAVVRGWALAAEHAAASAMPRNQQGGDEFAAAYGWAQVADGAADTAAEWAGEWGVVLDG